MHILKTVCQVRRDLDDEIPDVVLQLPRVRVAIPKLIGKDQPDQDDPDTEHLLQALEVNDPTKAAALRKKARSRIVVLNGLFEGQGTAKPESFIVEDLTIGQGSLYIQAFAPTKSCQSVLDAATGLLVQAGVPELTLRSYQEDFATVTVAELGGRIEQLFSEGFKTLINTDIVRSAQRKESTKVLVHPYQISLKVHTWQADAQDPIAAKPDRWDFEIAHQSFEDHDKQVFTVRSHFDYEKHVLALESLDKVLSHR